MNKQSLIALFVFLALVAIVCGVGLTLYRTQGLPMAASGQAFGLEMAIDAYHEQIGSYPPGESNAEITAALQGENPEDFDFLLATGIRYEVFIAVQEQPDGSRVAVDVWKNPLQISIPPTSESPAVISAGPDGMPGTSDDITSEKARSLEPAKRAEDPEA
ncbi:hypothetical protein BH23VER1_BH23VER1_19260 [soil metagenome]